MTLLVLTLAPGLFDVRPSPSLLADLVDRALDPSPSPFSLEWYYRLGEDASYLPDSTYEFVVEGCGTFRGYYYLRVDDSADVVAEAAAACAFLTGDEEEERCETTLVKVDRNRTLTHARCRSSGSCGLDRVC